MRIERLTNQLQIAISDAQSLALGKDHNFIEPVHLLSALLNQKNGSVRGLITQAGANLSMLTKATTRELSAIATVDGVGADIHMSNDLARVLNLADKLSQKEKDAYVSSEWVLLAMLDTKLAVSRLLQEAGLDKTSLQAGIEQLRGGESVSDPAAEESRQALEKYTVNLSARRRVSWTRLLAATTKYAAPFKCCSGAPKTTRY